jgi:hypothetical protein
LWGLFPPDSLARGTGITRLSSSLKVNVMMVDQQIEAMLRHTMRCNVCFESGKGLRRSLVDTPQPRPVGKGYETSDLRIVLVVEPERGHIRRARRWQCTFSPIATPLPRRWTIRARG